MRFAHMVEGAVAAIYDGSKPVIKINGEVIPFRYLPIWHETDGQGDELTSRGLAAIAEPEQPEYDPATQDIEHVACQVGDLEATDRWVVTDKTQAEIDAYQAAQDATLREQITAERERRIELGTTVTIEAGGLGDLPLQGRDQDMIDYMALERAAQKLISDGITEPSIVFRDGANVEHLLTPAQMIEAYEKGAAWVQAVYQASWALKDADPIPTSFADDAHWP